MTTKNKVILPRVEWTAELPDVIYLRLLPDPPQFMMQIQDGPTIFDVNAYDHSEVYGVEMLGCPIGEHGYNIPAWIWVLAGRAWQEYQIRKKKIIAHHSPKTTGSFHIPHGGE